MVRIKMVFVMMIVMDKRIGGKNKDGAGDDNCDG